MSIEIINLTGNWEAIKTGEYIGRGNHHKGLKASPLANRFIIGMDGDRATVIAKYEAWLKAKISAGDRDVLDELARLASIACKGKVVLCCFCTPLPCHADVIKRALEEVMRTEDVA